MRMDPKRLPGTLERMREDQRDDQRLRAHLEGLCGDPAFPGLTWFWGPLLYARNTAIFRPFILQHFADWALATLGRTTRVVWAEHATDLEPWLDAARVSRDRAMVRRLQRWKYAASKGWGIDNSRFS